MSQNTRGDRSATFESLNYDEAENDLVRVACALPDAERRQLHRREYAVVGTLVVITGFLVGSTSYFSTYLIEEAVHWKYHYVQDALDQDRIVDSWLIFSGFVLAFALFAAILTRWAPEAAGSGIPHVKAYLNGNRLDGALRPRTLVAKVLGISSCVAAGMPAGREGPMVHAGAVIAKVFATGRVVSECSYDCFRVDLDNDYISRNFVSMGAAAGVAAAFHAPIGGASPRMRACLPMNVELPVRVSDHRLPSIAQEYSSASRRFHRSGIRT